MSNTPSTRRLWAVVPAAGLSRRMGRPKLLLELAGRTVMARLVDALRTGGCDDIWVLARGDDAELLAVLATLPVHCVIVEAPTADMRASVVLLLDAITDCEQPQSDDGWLLCPADHPVLSVTVVAAVLAAREQSPSAVIVPSHHSRRGHPTLFPWRLAERIHDIPPNQGLNWLLRQPDVVVCEVPVDDPSILTDLDTPEDYERAARQFFEHGS